MSATFHRLTLLWVMAVSLQLPVPVCDGDDCGALSAASMRKTACAGFRLDIDFILLGRDLPDDVDDGPVDDDPDDHHGAAFDTFLRSCHGRICRAVLTRYRSLLPVQEPADTATLRLSVTRTGSIDPSRLNLSFGKRCGSGLVIIRC